VPDVASPPVAGDVASDPARSILARSRWIRLTGLAVCLAALFAVALLSVWFGTRDIPLTEVWRLLWADPVSYNAVTIQAYRVPRTLLGIIVGIALGLAGALMQALTRNPLADPGLLGVNLGAATGVVAGVVFLGLGSVLEYVWLALAGAALASVVVYTLGMSGRSSAAPERLVLGGSAVAAVLYAVNTAIVMLFPLAFDDYRFWTVGSLAGRDLSVVKAVAPFIGLGVVIAVLLARPLNALTLGEQLGRALGVHVGRTRVATALAVMLLCGAATAAAGPIWFVGLAVPHIARLIVGPDQRWVLTYSLLLAPILLLASDVLGRVLGAPTEIEVGIVTAFVGGPIFIALCRRRKLAAL